MLKVSYRNYEPLLLIQSCSFQVKLLTHLHMMFDRDLFPNIWLLLQTHELEEKKVIDIN